MVNKPEADQGDSSEAVSVVQVGNDGDLDKMVADGDLDEVVADREWR